ncbi:V-set and immunoglobulin domain-containing protein 10-like isoform X1 [Carassius auratus]|uniref:V-set and immunoglobulin domain-containing protein 10-like isoform X1 n=1 Tax=Carassius auratus TaxID=7957 RepID=UPI000E40AD78|nr:V-set and immunoglobulin domain-containing protein 10-like isoform X1 [Carassius auratus]
MGYPDNPKIMISAIVLYLLLLLHQTGSEEQVQRYIIREKGENAVLQCLDQPVNESSLLYRWKKDGIVVAATEHLSILNNGSLLISGLQSTDVGQYECESQTKNGILWQTISNILLRVSEGPTSVSLAIKPATLLPNGTLYVQKDLDVYFNCSSECFPSQNLTWTVENLALDINDKASGNKSFLDFFISKIQPSHQGMYTCTSQNTLSKTTVNKSQELLVYYAPERHPECSWVILNEPYDVLFKCKWHGGYPVPTLNWQEVREENVIAKGPTINSTSQETECLEVYVNSTMMHNVKEVKCIGHHVTGVEKNCSFELKRPYPLGDPLVTALEGSNITLKCTETDSLPPAKTVWKQKDNIIINTTSKYIVEDKKPHYKLIIINVTKEDEGAYYCYSENLLDARALEVFLTVKTSAGNGGVVVGVFVSILIMMIGVTVGVMVYSKRDRICIGLGFSHLDNDRWDVLSLVDSDEEEIVHETVPQLPPPTNGHATTLVEIHRIPSVNSDHEDNADSTDHQTQTEPVQQSADS